ncbi:radical SAM family heme chaperone HemW [Fervidibacillus albus]|uniref:Heme chaperone HemW n=1 Tax=Fervidibacillus albus TaxID=2980026 RepID=A0A9E8RWJ4_9BACI|nr:radical SAM family heme chaperone HemW [Fervidibacillus albus]WAA10364.1 radical SAM family heme chaperone HemW [Fervidibacillus albus]
MAKAVYIHIPFCTQICHYCDFNKVFLSGQPVDDYLAALKKEMEMTLVETPTEHVETVFIGGGTPTAINERHLERLLETIHQVLPLNGVIEFTIEANPGDLNEDKIRLLKDAGVNRLSLGVQTFDNELLKKIGRNHRDKDVYETVEIAKKIGFDNLSIDLMYRLPGQTMEHIRYALSELAKLDVSHASIYSLIIEPKTVFYNLMRKGKLLLPSEDTEADMYHYILEEMAIHGFEQYEISNFSKPGFESRHNLFYWNNDSYYGFGAGAHSYLNGNRSSNIGPVNHYIQALKEHRLPIKESIRVTKREQMEEEMFLGLRKTAGVSVHTFFQKYGVDPRNRYQEQVHNLTEQGLLEVTNGYIRLTKRGLFLGNEVFQSFIGV